VAKLVGLKSSRRVPAAAPEDVLRLHGDPSRLRRLLGRSPAIDIAEGLAPTGRLVPPQRENHRAGARRDAAENWAEAPAESWIGDERDPARRCRGWARRRRAPRARPSCRAG
jgi:hypothetical protein